MYEAVFEIKRNAVGYYYFIFRTTAEISRLCSHSFADRAALERCVADLREIVPLADVEESSSTPQAPPRFLIAEAEQGFQFTLHGLQDEHIFTSDPSPDRAHCLRRIMLLKSLISQARVLDHSGTPDILEILKGD